MSEAVALKDAKGVTKEQLAFVEHAIKGDNVILSATAGSGKTFSCVHRLKYLVEKGVDPKRIIFFSFTVAAVEELKARIKNDDIKITTIHAFCLGLLSKMGKFKKIASFYDFIGWFRDEHKPKGIVSDFERSSFYNEMEKLYEDAEFISSHITAYKLQKADSVKCTERMPDYFREYQRFLKETKSRDFSDMLIEVRDLLKETKWLKMFRGKYDYIFVDEYQDTSTIQMQILLSLNAQYYYLIGDRSQSLYGYSGANCDAVEAMLRKRRKTIEMSLTMNFRSAKLIVENSNLYTNLMAIPFHKHDGDVNKDIIFFESLPELFEKHQEVAVLVRTNSVIRDMEKRLLKMQIPIRYFNYLTPAEIEDMIKGKERTTTKRKVAEMMPEFKSPDRLVSFIRESQNNKSFITTIHKSKGREFDTCVVVNSLSPALLEHNGLSLPKEQFEAVSFDPTNDEHFEARNVHYVAVSRAKNNLYFMIMGV
jgi:DNA helicase-2/ATP-dependent DNA helicase PcrA